MLNDPAGEHYGYELSEESGVRSGVLYPILTRMLAEGWVTDDWEDPKKITGKKRPPRRYYRITGTGRRALAEVVAKAREDTRFRGFVFPQPNPGVAR